MLTEIVAGDACRVEKEVEQERAFSRRLSSRQQVAAP